MKLATGWIALGVAALLPAGLTACSTGTGTVKITVDDNLKMDHIHGLGVDPADGVLYAATHNGLFRVSSQGKATRVTSQRQDTMGFTVVGPNTFLGSGHPDRADNPDLPSQLGLIRSTNAARTWKAVSLVGEADFHALHVAHGVLYGWDSSTGELMASSTQGRM
ncbi:exo-alpha-sialidase, partial [Enterococcus hirae]|nr:exo-alpha-sialidase [Enterococcus hirae]